MIVVKSRYLFRPESGSGIGSVILNKVISSSIAHTVADTVAQGAKAAAKKVVEKKLVDLVLKRPRIKQELEKEEKELDNKRQRLDKIINGQGIILD